MSWTKVEAVVIRERVETVIDAVEDATGHVGVTVIEAIGHGRAARGSRTSTAGASSSRGSCRRRCSCSSSPTRASTTSSRAIVDAARSGNESGDGLVWTTPVENVMHNRPGTQPGGGGRRCLATRIC